MKTIKLPLKKRESGEKSAETVPGVIYGKEIDNVHVSADALEFKRIYREAGSNHIVDVEVDGKEHEVLFKEVQVDPVQGEPVHFDLYAIVRGQKVTTEVPVVLVGDAPAVKTGKTVNTFIDKLTISTTPRNIPDSFEVSAETLVELDDTLTVADLKIGEEIELLNNEESDMIAKVEEIREMQIEDPDADKEMPGEEPELDEDGNPIVSEGDEGAEEGEGDSESGEEKAADKKEEASEK